MSVIRICPYRTYTEVRPAILKGQGDVMVTGFMECLKEQCPAFRTKERYSYRLGDIEPNERCLRLEGETLFSANNARKFLMENPPKEGET